MSRTGWIEFVLGAWLLFVSVALFMVIRAIRFLLNARNMTYPGTNGPRVGDILQLDGLVGHNDRAFPSDIRGIVFLALGCAQCDTVKSDLARLPVADSRIGVVCQGKPSRVDDWALVGLPDSTVVVADATGSISGMFNVRAVPFFVGLDSQRRCCVAGFLNEQKRLQSYMTELDGQLPFVEREAKVPVES